jgi:hypothetical protein
MLGRLILLGLIDFSLNRLNLLFDSRHRVHISQAGTAALRITGRAWFFNSALAELAAVGFKSRKTWAVLVRNAKSPTCGFMGTAVRDDGRNLP